MRKSTCVELNGVQYPYTFGLGSMMMWECLTGLSFAGVDIARMNVIQLNVLHYSCLRNGSEEFRYSFAEYMRMVKNRKSAKALTEALEREVALWNQDNATDEEEETHTDEKKNL